MPKLSKKRQTQAKCKASMPAQQSSHHTTPVQPFVYPQYYVPEISYQQYVPLGYTGTASYAPNGPDPTISMTGMAQSYGVNTPQTIMQSMIQSAAMPMTPQFPVIGPTGYPYHSQMAFATQHVPSSANVQPFMIVNGNIEPISGPPPELLWSEISKM